MQFEIKNLDATISALNRIADKICTSSDRLAQALEKHSIALEKTNGNN